MTSGNLSPLPKPSLIFNCRSENQYLLLPVFPVEQLVTFHFIYIPQLAVLYNNMQFAVFPKFVQHFIDLLDALQSQLVQLQAGWKIGWWGMIFHVSSHNGTIRKTSRKIYMGGEKILPLPPNITIYHTTFYGNCKSQFPQFRNIPRCASTSSAGPSRRSCRP